MSLDNTKPSKQPINDESQTSKAGGGGRKTSALKPPEQTLKCPRCDSPNTKFCYYNNYSLAQPRHFCKTCRRYWTKGGAQRKVPIGGGCRNSKKTKSCSSSSRFINGDSSSCLDIGGMSLFTGLSSPAIDFQLGGLNHLSSSSIMNFDSLGFNLPLHGGFQEIGTVPNNLVSSIESLSSINQDLHWKLQQQRLAALFGGRGGGGGETEQQINHQNQIVMDQCQARKLHPILFQNLEIPKPSQTSMDGDFRKDGGGLETEWFFDGNYAPANVDPTLSIASINADTAGIYENGSINNWNNGIDQGWNQFNDQYSTLDQ